MGSAMSRFVRWIPVFLVAIAATLTVVPIWVEFEGGWDSCGSVVFRSTVGSRAGTRAGLCEEIGAYRDRITLALVLFGVGVSIGIVRMVLHRVAGRRRWDSVSGE